MDRRVKILIGAIGGLSLVSGLYLAATGSEFSDYFPGIFIGLTLMGSVFFIDSRADEDTPD